MHLFGLHLPLVVVIAIGIAVAYAINYLILKTLYCNPDFLRYKWRQRLLWGIGLIPVSGIIILGLAVVVAIFVFVVVLIRGIRDALFRRRKPT